MNTKPGFFENIFSAKIESESLDSCMGTDMDMSPKKVGDYIYESMCSYHHNVLNANQRIEVRKHCRDSYFSGELSRNDYFKYLKRVVFAEPELKPRPQSERKQHEEI